MDSYPGPLGQVVTNLFLNAVNHAFEGDRAGTISIVARTSGADMVHIVFRDSGAGMSERSSAAPSTPSSPPAATRAAPGSACTSSTT
jgi:two-component sensor histidine kinase